MTQSRLSRGHIECVWDVVWDWEVDATNTGSE